MNYKYYPYFLFRLMIKALKSILPYRLYLSLRRIYAYLTYFFYFGFKYHCPICKKSFRKFLSYGLNIPVLKEKKVIGGGYYSLNRLCPFCYTDERRRLLYLFLKNRTNIFTTNKQIKLLHIAPEQSLRTLITKNPNIKYFDVDLYLSLVKYKADITNLKFKKNYFDAIICCHVLEHIQDDMKAMSELYRVLKPNGWAILQVPISPVIKETVEYPEITSENERKRLFGQKDHVRIYGRDYKNRLESVGFNVKIDNSITTISKFVSEYSLNKEESIYFCKK